MDVVDESTETKEDAQGPAKFSLEWVKQQLHEYDDFQAEASQLTKLFRRRG